MVFTSPSLSVRSRGPDEFWRKRKIFQIAAHFGLRHRNCYSMTIRAVHRAWQYAVRGRHQKKYDMRELWNTRITAATQEHGISPKLFTEGLARCNILLNHRTLADLAIWEPRTFKCLTDIAHARVKQDGLKGSTELSLPTNVISQGLIK